MGGNFFQKGPLFFTPKGYLRGPRGFNRLLRGPNKEAPQFQKLVGEALNPLALPRCAPDYAFSLANKNYISQRPTVIYIKSVQAVYELFEFVRFITVYL